jgi:hypothetical protein
LPASFSWKTCVFGPAVFEARDFKFSLKLPSHSAEDLEEQGKIITKKCESAKTK